MEEERPKAGRIEFDVKRQPYKERFELFQRLVNWTVGVQGQLPIITKY